MKFFSKKSPGNLILDARLPSNITEDEKLALHWLSKTDHRKERVIWAGITGGLFSGIYGGFSLMFEKQLPTNWALGLILIVILMGVSSGILMEIVHSIVPISLSRKKGFIHCVKTTMQFCNLSRTHVGASNLPQEIRKLHMQVNIASNNGLRGTEKVLRKIYNKVGPEAALDFMRFCSAFKDGNKILDADIVVTDEMKRVARNLVKDLYDSKPTHDAILLDMSKLIPARIQQHSVDNSPRKLT